MQGGKTAARLPGCVHCPVSFFSFRKLRYHEGGNSTKEETNLPKTDGDTFLDTWHLTLLELP